MDVERFRWKITNIDWSGYYENRVINWLNNFLEENLREILESEAPLKGFQARGKYHSWVSSEMKELMRQRDSLKMIARQSGDPEDRRRYNRARNICTKELEKTKKKHFSDMYKTFENGNNLRMIYGMTRKLLGWKTGGMP